MDSQREPGATPDERAVAELFGALVADAPPSELSPLSVLAAAKREQRLGIDARQRRSRWTKGALIAAVVAGLAVVIVPKLDLGVSSNATSAPSSAIAADATVAAAGASSAAGTASAAEGGAAGSAASSAGPNAAGSSAAASSAALSSAAGSTSAASSAAASSAAASGGAGFSAPTAAAPPTLASSGAAASSPASAPGRLANDACPSLNAAAVKAARDALKGVSPEPKIFAVQALPDGCLARSVGPADGGALVNITVSRAAPPCKATTGCTSDQSLAGSAADARATATAYGKGFKVEVERIGGVGKLTAAQLVAVGRAVLGTLG